jgi:hypothetical protein
MRTRRCVALAAFGAGGLLTSGCHNAPDLAKGRPWRASSEFAACDPVHASCANAVTVIFFHTNEEESPWVEYDLGEPETIHQVEVQNRLDCCQDRAVPLVVEVGDDAKSWTQVARREEPFGRWIPTFPPRRARYVRLRVARRSMLHLELVAIR